MFTWYGQRDGHLTITLTEDQASQGYHQGQCDDDIRDLLRDPEIAAQVAKWDASTLRDELRDYGAWDDDELSDDDANIERMLWLACGDIHDDPDSYRD